MSNENKTSHPGKRQRARRGAGFRARSFTALKSWPDAAIKHLHFAFKRKLLGRGPTWSELLQEVNAKFGVTWNDSSLSRYFSYWLRNLSGQALVGNQILLEIRNAVLWIGRLLAQVVERKR